MNFHHESNRRVWDAMSPSWQKGIDEKGKWRRCPTEPTIILSERELSLLGDVRGKHVCVLGSGDNLVVFALAGMGAGMTSVDFSQVQLNIAAGRARELGLEIRFVRHDVTDLRSLRDDSFDVVYTGGHVAVWVNDLKKYYAEAVRILQPGGLFLVNEYHPLRRLWGYEPGPLRIQFDYCDRGPHEYDSDYLDGAKQYEFHWTVADYVNALLDAGCNLEAVEEFGDEREAWEPIDLSGLPRCLLLAGRKSAGSTVC